MNVHQFTFSFIPCPTPIEVIAYMVYDIFSDLVISENCFTFEKDGKPLNNFNDVSKVLAQNDCTIILKIKKENREPKNILNVFQYPDDLEKHFGIKIKYLIFNEKLSGIDNKSDENNCLVCLDNEVQIAFANCKHLVICFLCYNNLRDNSKCIYCRSINTGIITKNDIDNIENFIIP